MEDKENTNSTNITVQQRLNDVTSKLNDIQSNNDELRAENLGLLELKDRARHQMTEMMKDVDEIVLYSTLIDHLSANLKNSANQFLELLGGGDNAENGSMIAQTPNAPPSASSTPRPRAQPIDVPLTPSNMLVLQHGNNNAQSIVHGKFGLEYFGFFSMI